MAPLPVDYGGDVADAVPCCYDVLLLHWDGLTVWLELTERALMVLRV